MHRLVKKKNMNIFLLTVYIFRMFKFYKHTNLVSQTLKIWRHKFSFWCPMDFFLQSIIKNVNVQFVQSKISLFYLGELKGLQ